MLQVLVTLRTLGLWERRLFGMRKSMKLIQLIFYNEFSLSIFLISFIISFNNAGKS